MELGSQRMGSPEPSFLTALTSCQRSVLYCLGVVLHPRFPFYSFFFFFFLNTIYNLGWFFLNWSIVDLQCCVSFRYTAKWFSYTYIYIYIHIFSDSFPLYIFCTLLRAWLSQVQASIAIHFPTWRWCLFPRLAYSCF